MLIGKHLPRPQLMTCALFMFFCLGVSGYAQANETGGHGHGGSSGGEAAMVTVDTLHESMPGEAPIIKPFQEMFDRCAQQAMGMPPNQNLKCQFQNMGVLPSKEHCSKNAGSCHNIGKAIDVGKIKCGDREISPKTAVNEYNKLAVCFLTDKEKSGQGKFNQVIYTLASPQFQAQVAAVPNGAKLVQKEEHEDHVHIQWDCENGDGLGRGACVNGQAK